MSRGKLNYLKYANFIELEDWWHLEAQLKKAANHYMDSESDVEFMALLDGLDNKFKSGLVKLFNARKTDLTTFFVCESSNISQTNLKDFDWSVKVNI